MFFLPISFKEFLLVIFNAIAEQGTLNRDRIYFIFAASYLLKKGLRVSLKLVVQGCDFTSTIKKCLPQLFLVCVCVSDIRFLVCLKLITFVWHLLLVMEVTIEFQATFYEGELPLHFL